MKTVAQLQTMAVSYQEICAGERPWTALGNFMNDFFGNFPDRRQDLINDPLLLPATPAPEQQRWAAFCAAAVDYLCEQHGMACPEWVQQQVYILAEPWFQSEAALHVPRIAERYRQSTPSAFARRNIFCGDRVFNNKYEPAPQHHAA
jgi:hypothetical protein